jgi:hypothetical protein
MHFAPVGGAGHVSNEEYMSNACKRLEHFALVMKVDRGLQVYRTRLAFADTSFQP